MTENDRFEPTDPEASARDEREPARDLVPPSADADATRTDADPGSPGGPPVSSAEGTLREPGEAEGIAPTGSLHPNPARGSGRGTVALVLVLGAAALVLVVAVSFLAGIGVERLGLLGPATEVPAPSGSSGDSASSLALFGEAWDLIHTKYVDAVELDSRQLAYAAIDAMTDAVGDTGHTMFLTPEEYATSQSALSGSYAGIGAQLDIVDDEPVIVGVFRDTPADRAGLRRDDVILRVDGTDVTDEAIDAVVGRIRGPEGTSVTLTIRRTGEAQPLEFTIVRATVEIPVVGTGTVPGTTIGMIRLEQFSSQSGDAFRRGLQGLLDDGATGLIVDLRANPGGYVAEAVKVASEFLVEGVVFRERDASREEKTTEVTSGGIAPTLPIVILVDEATASAAEIVTGALQDPKRGRVVGTRTFGTGTVLATYELSDGSALRIGTVEWLTPSGRRIWHDGLMPDVVVELPESARPVIPEDLATLSANELRASDDTQVLKAIELLLGRAY